MPPSRARLWEEFWKLVRFGIVGGLSFALHSLVYILLSRVLWEDGPRFWQNVASVVAASFFNFLAHRSWTYRAHKVDLGQLGRYVVTIVSAAALQSVLFWFGHTVLHVYDLIVLIGAVGCVALYTYVVHRWFTFAHPKDIKASNESWVDPVV